MSSNQFDIENYPMHKYFMLKSCEDKDTVSSEEILSIRSRIDLVSNQDIITKKCDFNHKNSNKKMKRDLKKFYRNRYKLFSKFDEGIILDSESWFSVTPEAIAEYLAKRLQCNFILDAFCGSGGNSIQFAKYCNKVLAIDIDDQKLNNLKHNSFLYGVADKIECRNTDYLELANPVNEIIDAVFLAPPWGGVSYNKKKYCLFEDVYPDVRKVLRHSLKFSNKIVMLMPRNSILSEYAQLFWELPKRVNLHRWCLEFEEIYLDGKFVEIAVYFGSASLISKKNELKLYSFLIDPRNDAVLTKNFEMHCKLHGLKNILRIYFMLRNSKVDESQENLFAELMKKIMKMKNNLDEEKIL